MCMEPVGKGAIRVTTGRSDIELESVSVAGAQSERAAPISMGFPPRPGFHRIAAWLVDQASVQSWTLWSPVAFGAGAAIYLALPGEPLALVAYGLLALAAALVWIVRHFGPSRPVAVLLLLTAFAMAGFAGGLLNQPPQVAQRGGASRERDGM